MMSYLEGTSLKVNKGRINYDYILEDIEHLEKEDDSKYPEDSSIRKKKSEISYITPSKPAKDLLYSKKPPTNIPNSKYYSMKNTLCGRSNHKRKEPDNKVKDIEMICEDIMKCTYLQNLLVEDYFREYSK
jgi:hypothetical protein